MRGGGGEGSENLIVPGQLIFQSNKIRENNTLTLTHI